MSNTKELKQYLLEKENAFLLNDISDGKTIMISGAWGAGKTHFWQNEIEPSLSDKLKTENKACVYVSLYGKDNLESLKKEIYINAFSKNKLISKEISSFGFDALSSIKDSDLAVGKTLKAFSDLNNYRKQSKGSNRLKNGGVICLDDFERKSKNIDLNDLFGFISQLAIEMRCKVIIILNSDVFTGKEAEVFKNVKEKTVNKFFNFNPTIEELFKSISSDDRYNELNTHKKYILKVIKETNELNARIYIQVLDNCLEWIRINNEEGLRTLILSTINFIKNHFLFDLVLLDNGERRYSFINQFVDEFYEIANYLIRTLPQLDSCSMQELLHMMRTSINRKDEKEQKSDEYYKKLNIVFENNQKSFQAFAYYLYILKIDENIDDDILNKINKFIKSGILI